MASGSFAPPLVPIDWFMKKDFDACALLMVDILVRRGFLTRVYFSFLMELML